MSKNLIVSGTITCTQQELATFSEVVSEHINLTRAEPGCIEFDIKQDAPGSCTFLIAERFTNRAAFESHTARTRASDWWGKTQHIPRDINITEE